MHIADAILHANSAGVVLFLLTSYIEAIRHEGVEALLPEPCTAPEYRQADEVARCLAAVLKREAQRGEPPPDSIVGEILHVFGAALNRLRQLERARVHGAAEGDDAGGASAPRRAEPVSRGRAPG